MSRNPTLGEIANDAAQGALDEMFVSAVARVLRYDSSTQQVDVQVIQKVRHFDSASSPVVEQLPVIPGVPVQFPGGGGYTVTFPIAVGDTVLVVFSGLSMDKWLHGASDEPLDPEAHTRHALADAVAIPGVKPFSRPRSSAPTDHVRIGLDGADAQGVGLGAEIKGYFDSLRGYLQTLLGPGLSIYNAHTHAGGTISGSTAVPSVQIVTSFPAVPDVESDTVKVTE